MRILILLTLILIFCGGCGKETPVGTVRIEEPPEARPKPLPTPEVTMEWYYDPVLGDPSNGWRVRMYMDLSGDKTQELIDAVDYYRIEYGPSVPYKNYPNKDQWRRGGYKYEFPHLFQVGIKDRSDLQPDFGCFDIKWTVVAKAGSGYVNSEALEGYIFAYKDYSHWIRGKQPNCWGQDEYSGLHTPWRNAKLHFLQGGG